MIQEIKPYRLQQAYVPGKQPDNESRVLYFSEDCILAETDGHNIRVPVKREFCAGGRFVFLFSILQSGTLENPTDYFLCLDRKPQLQEDTVTRREESAFRMVPVRSLRKMDAFSGPVVFAVYTGWHLFHWYDEHRFCGRCGERMQLSGSSRKLFCPSCSLQIYPEIIPAVTVGVIDGNKILLTRNRRRPASYDSLIAGYVEVGETFEEAVKREVLEESGLHVRNIRYYKSQPWGISQTIMAGFFCDVEGAGEIRMEKEELTMAAWTPREEVRPQIDEQSLTNEMMMAFRQGIV